MVQKLQCKEMPMMKMEKGTKKCTNKSVKSYDQK